MEKPGPRPAARPLIIERPDLQSPPQRLVSAGLTVLFWAAWVYLWLPVVALLGWAFGVSRFHREMVVEHGDRALLHVLGWYALAIGLLAGALVCWALYNLIRFRGRERRTTRTRVDVAQIAAQAALAPDALQAWQRERVLYVAHDASGRIIAVDTRPAPVAQPANAADRNPPARDEPAS